jgi:hypothetical protein
MMRNLASLAALAFFLLGLAGTAQAGSVTCHAILECKTDKSGDIVVVAFTDGDNGRVAADIEKGDDCTQALESLLDPGDGDRTSFVIRNISTGSTDRTVYTMAASFDANNCEPPEIPSDARLKTDIVRIGSSEHGLPLYQFRYIGSDAVWEGVMAQDVLLYDPGAVVIGEDGFMAVDYGRLGIELTLVQ